MKPLLCLCTLLLSGSFLAAAPVVLYETGWEAAPASPAWAPGNIPGQNGWLNFNSAAGHQVVVNGTAGASVDGQPVLTPFGDQMHRFNGSASTVDPFLRLAWVDVTAGFDSRPADFNFLTGSIDLFVPSARAIDTSLYGIMGFDGNTTDFAIFVDPSTLSVILFNDLGVVASVPNAFTLDTWLNLSVSANYETGEIFGSINGTPVPGLSGISDGLLVGGFTDLDLAVQNDPAAPAERSIFSDNYRVQLDLVPVPEPSAVLLVIAGVAVLLWRMRRARA